MHIFGLRLQIVDMNFEKYKRQVNTKVVHASEIWEWGSSYVIFPMSFFPNSGLRKIQLA
jgi:hypothetical protein